jgi:hypothetical protein
MVEKIKFKVTLKELSFEYEGTREGLVDTQRTAMLPSTPSPTHAGVDGDGPAPVVIDQQAQPAEKAKKTRRTNGVSLTGLLRDLKAERFFGEPRSVDGVRERLKTKGHTFPDSTISSRILDLTKKNELFRSMVGEVWLYKDTPFDENPRTADAPERPAE